jgi:tripartite ATP-independent transporter DctM subunit
MTELPLPVIGLVGAFVFLALMFLRMHIGLAMMIGGFVGIVLSRGFEASLSTLSTTVFRSASAEYLAVLPLFILMGILAGELGVSAGAFNTFYKWVGHLRGGLAMASVATCAAFGAVCGDNVATAATMTKVALPEMRKYGYKDVISTGSLAAGGNLGILIPPSQSFIVYGFVTQTAIGALFIAGIIPGLLLTVLMCLTIYIWCRTDPAIAQVAQRATWKERIVALKGIWGILAVFVLVMGGLLEGFFTPTEAGAVGAVAVIVVSLVNRTFKFKPMLKALLDSTKITAMIMLLILGAMVFSHFLTTSEIAQAIANTIRAAHLNPYIVIFGVMVVYIIGGCFMDIWALMIITLPIFYPLISDLGFDSLQFGVLCTLCVMLGSITPPVGVVVFALSGMIRDVPMFTIFRGVTPFLACMVVMMVLVVFFPQLSTFLPDLMIPFR